MTQRARRIYYSLAFLVFLILAPIVLALANGYQWAGWRAGFTPTGVLVVSTSPKATISINGQVEEETNKLTKRLRPGQYEISIARRGYTTWTTLIGIKARAADVIGPVVLFPVVLPVGYQSSTAADILTDPVRHITVSVQSSTAGWEVRQLWPTGATWTIALTNKPSAVSFSPKQRLVVVQTPTQAVVATPGSSDVPWVISPIDHIFWGDSGDAVLYGQRGNQLLLLDSLAKTETIVAARNSAGWFDRQLWSTETIAGQTLLYRQAAEALEPILVRDFVGTWEIEPAPDGVLFIRNQTDHQAIAYINSQRNEPLALGVIDQLWWPERGQPPLWQSGTQLYTLDDRNQPLLLERGPEAYQGVYWIVPEHILASFDGLTVTFRSVSSRQGRGVLLKQTLPTKSELLGVDRGKKVLVFRTTGSPTSLFTMSWE